MTSPYLELADRIRGGIVDLGMLVARVQEAWEPVQTRAPNHRMFLDSVALNLHGFYSGLERPFELTAKNIDEDLPTGSDWHKALLEQMSVERPDIRPAVVAPEHLSELDELRRFRHLVRNVYAFNLFPERIEPLVKGLSDLWRSVRSELLAFADLLEDLSR